jgi:hypothetical protein
MGFFRFSGAKEQILDIPAPGPPVTVVFRSPDGTPLAARNVVLGVDGIMDVRRFAERSLASGSDTASRADGSLRILGLPARGALTLYPLGRPDLAVTRDLPVADPVLFTLPLEDFDRK